MSIAPLALLTLGTVAASPSRLTPTTLTETTVTTGFRDPAVSPDGARIAISLLGKIWIVPASGGVARQITSGSGWDGHPAWSPDGRFLAYTHQRPGRVELVLHGFETGGERTLYSTEGGRVIGQIGWRGAEGEILFILETHQYMAHLWSVPIRGDKPAKAITQGPDQTEWSFAVSPDGREVALEWVQRGPRDLVMVTLDSVHTRRITETPEEESSVQWSRDGKSLVYLSRDNGIDRVIVRDLSSGATRPVFESPFDGKQLALFPDGRSAVLVAGRTLYRLDLTSGKLTPIPIEAHLTLPDRDTGNLVITNVRLWDGTGAPVQDGAWVAVRNGRITETGTGAPSAGLNGVPTIDGGGKFLLPGLMDNHYHYWNEWTFEAARLLSTGITTIRDPGSDLAETLNLRNAIRLGILSGPDVYTAGPIIDGPCAVHPRVNVLLDRPEAGPALVRALKAAGVDFIKVYHCLKPEVARTVIGEARRLGMQVTGDLGNVTHWDTAIEAGITGLNHAYTYRGAYLPPLYQIFRDTDPPDLWLARWRLQGNIPVDPDRPEVDSVLAVMARRHVAMDPTIHIFSLADSSRRALGIAEGERALARWQGMKRFVKKVVDARVLLLAGTDDLSLNDELEDYETIGIDRTIILQSATRNGAQWLEAEREFGTIEPGRKAHLLLVDGNPLAQIKDLRNVELVVKDGRIAFRRQ